MFIVFVENSAVKKTHVEEFLKLDFKNKIFLAQSKEYVLDSNCFLIKDLAESGLAWFQNNPKTNKPFFMQFNWRKWFF